MAVYLGLGALLFTSLYLFTRGADLWTYLIRGVLALAIFSTAGWGYGHWLRGLYERNVAEEELPENVERRTRDAHAPEGRVISHAEMPESVIPAEAHQEAQPFVMPEFGDASQPEDSLKAS